MSIVKYLEGFFPISFAEEMTPEAIAELESNVLLLTASSEELSALDGVLHAHNLQRGKLIGAGILGGLTFALETTSGQKINSAVVRFDQKNITYQPAPGETVNPGMIKPVAQFSAYEKPHIIASIVPKAEKGNYNVKDITPVLALFNAEDKLLYLSDVNPTQFMEINGEPTLIDLSSYGSLPVGHRDRPDNGSLEKSIATYNSRTPAGEPIFDLEAIHREKASAQELQRRYKKQAEVDRNIRQELAQKGVHLDIPTEVNGATVTPLTTPGLHKAK